LPLTTLTHLGGQKHTAIDQRQIAWINELSAGLDSSDSTTTGRLHDLSDRLETTARTARRTSENNDFA